MKLDQFSPDPLMISDLNFPMKTMSERSGTHSRTYVLKI